MLPIAHDTYDGHETKTHNSWSHFWGKFWVTCIFLYMVHSAHDTWDRHETKTPQLVTFLGQILEHMHMLYAKQIAHGSYDRRETRTHNGGHIFGANFGT